MKTFDFIESAISHNVKDPHSKALEPDCLSPRLAIMTQSRQGEGKGEGKFQICLVSILIDRWAGNQNEIDHLKEDA